MPHQSHLGSVLVDNGLIDQNQLEKYQQRAEKQKKIFVELLLEDGICSDVEMAQTLSIQLGVPFVSLNQLRIPSYIAKMIQKDMAEKHKAIPVTVKNENGQEVLYVALLDPTDTVFLRELETLVKKPVVPVIATIRDIKGAIKRYFRPFRPKKKPKKDKKAQASASAPAAATPDPQTATTEPPTETIPVEVHSETPGQNEFVPEIEAEEFIFEEEETIEEIEASYGESASDPFMEDVPKLEDQPQEVDLLNGDDFAEATADIGSSNDSADIEDDIAEISALTPNINMDDFDIDLGLDDDNIPVADADNSPKTSIEKPGKIEEIPVNATKDQNTVANFDDSDFDDFDDDFGSGTDDTFDLETKEEGNTQSGAVDFLKYDSSELHKDDKAIQNMQEEAVNTRQEDVFSIEDDLDFMDSAEEVKTATTKGNNDSGSHYDLEFGEVNDQRSSQEDSLDEDDFDVFDFDIPEAPEFSVPPSSNTSSAAIPTLSANSSSNIETIEVHEPAINPPEEEEKEQASSEASAEEQDWSLDLDQLLKETGQYPIVKKTDEISDFEAAAQELDDLLVNEKSLSYDPPEAKEVKLEDDLLEKLSALSAGADENGKEEDLKFLNDFIEGKLEGSNDPGVEKLRSILASLKRSNNSSGKFTTPDFMIDFLKESLKKEK